MLNGASRCTETENRMPTNGSLGKHFYFQLAKEKLLICCSWTRLTSQSAECQCSERKCFTLCRREPAALKRVRAAGPETRLTGHSAKLLTQDTHCLLCQLPRTCSHSFPSEQSGAEQSGWAGQGSSVGGEAGAGGRRWRLRMEQAEAGLMISLACLQCWSRMIKFPPAWLQPRTQRSRADKVPWESMACL